MVLEAHGMENTCARAAGFYQAARSLSDATLKSLASLQTRLCRSRPCTTAFGASEQMAKKSLDRRVCRRASRRLPQIHLITGAWNLTLRWTGVCTAPEFEYLMRGRYAMAIKSRHQRFRPHRTFGIAPWSRTRYRGCGRQRLGDIPTMAHLLKYDSVHGRAFDTVEVTEDGFVADGHAVKVLCERVPENLRGATRRRRRC